MKNFTISLGIGLNMFFADYFTVDEPVSRHQSHYFDPKRKRRR